MQEGVWSKQQLLLPSWILINQSNIIHWPICLHTALCKGRQAFVVSLFWRILWYSQQRIYFLQQTYFDMCQSGQWAVGRVILECGITSMGRLTQTVQNILSWHDFMLHFSNTFDPDYPEYADKAIDQNCQVSMVTVSNECPGGKRKCSETLG